MGYHFSKEEDTPADKVDVGSTYLQMTEGVENEQAKKLIALGICTSLMTRVVEESCNANGVDIMMLPGVSAYALSIHTAAHNLVQLAEPVRPSTLEDQLSDENLEEVLKGFAEGK